MPSPNELLRHCEERSDEAIQGRPSTTYLDCFAALAMTATSYAGSG